LISLAWTLVDSAKPISALFMGIGGLRGGKMGTNGKMQHNPGWESGSMKTLAAHGLASKFPSGWVYFSGLFIV
jgi:hypothetical protein